MWRLGVTTHLSLVLGHDEGRCLIEKMWFGLDTEDKSRRKGLCGL